MRSDLPMARKLFPKALDLSSTYTAFNPETRTIGVITVGVVFFPSIPFMDDFNGCDKV